MSDRRSALQTVQVVTQAPPGMRSLGEVKARRCHRNFTEESPNEATLMADLRTEAYGQGADAIRYKGAERINGLLANCWYVLEGRAEMYAAK